VKQAATFMGICICEHSPTISRPFSDARCPLASVSTLMDGDTHVAETTYSVILIEAKLCHDELKLQHYSFSPDALAPAASYSAPTHPHTQVLVSFASCSIDSQGPGPRGSQRQRREGRTTVFAQERQLHVLPSSDAVSLDTFLTSRMCSWWNAKPVTALKSFWILLCEFVLK